MKYLFTSESVTPAYSYEISASKIMLPSYFLSRPILRIFKRGVLNSSTIGNIPDARVWGVAPRC